MTTSSPDGAAVPLERSSGTEHPSPALPTVERGAGDPVTTDRVTTDAVTTDAGTTDAVTTDSLTKRYGARTVVHDISFRVPTGSVTGLIGPNGAGKTTILAMLLGLVQPTTGEATVLGSPVAQRGGYLRRVGALIEAPAFHPAVSAIDNLRSLAVLGGLGQRRDEILMLIELVGLAGRGHDRYGTYSLGMKQRLGIAASLLGDPELVILDEPTNGLDPVGMQDVRRLIGHIAADGRTVLVSSHLLGELEQVCDWLIVLDRGGLVHLGPPESLGGTTGSLVVRAEDPAQLNDVAAIAAAIGLAPARGGADPSHRLVFRLDGCADVSRLAAEVNRRAHAAGIVLTEIHHARADLEARYLDLVTAETPGAPR